MKIDDIRMIVDKHRVRQGSTIAILEDIQAKYGYLPAEGLELLAKNTDIPLVDLYGIATFYRAFSLEPRGKHLVSVCMGTACHVRGAPRILDEVCKQLKIRPSQTTKDREFTLETVNCLGACALGPVMVVDGTYYSNMRVRQVKGVLQQAIKGDEGIKFDKDARFFPVQVSCPRCNHSLMDHEYTIDGHPSIYVNISFNQKHGWVRLSSVYGSYNVESKHEIPFETVVNFFCPHCNSELLGGIDCTDCGAPMVPFLVRGGGVVQICSRRGCRNHRLDVNGANL